MQVVFIAEMLLEKEYKEEKQTLRAAAFTAFLQGAGAKKTYKEYLKSIGLLEENKKQAKESRAEELKKSLEVIERVKKLTAKSRNRIHEKSI